MVFGFALVFMTMPLLAPPAVRAKTPAPAKKAKRVKKANRAEAKKVTEALLSLPEAALRPVGRAVVRQVEVVKAVPAPPARAVRVKVLSVRGVKQVPVRRVKAPPARKSQAQVQRAKCLQVLLLLLNHRAALSKVV